MIPAPSAGDCSFSPTRTLSIFCPNSSCTVNKSLECSWFGQQEKTGRRIKENLFVLGGFPLSLMLTNSRVECRRRALTWHHLLVFIGISWCLKANAVVKARGNDAQKGCDLTTSPVSHSGPEDLTHMCRGDVSLLSCYFFIVGCENIKTYNIDHKKPHAFLSCVRTLNHNVFTSQ